MPMLHPNCFFDCYSGFTAGGGIPAGDPRVVGENGEIRHHTAPGKQGAFSQLHWTTLLLVADGVDVRSGYNSNINGITPAKADTVVVRDYPRPGLCTPFLCVQVQRVRYGNTGYQRAYLDRALPQACGQQVQCCAGVYVHNSLTVTCTGFGCPCMTGVTIPLTWSSGAGGWQGTSVASTCTGGATVTGLLTCVGNVWWLKLTLNFSGGISVTINATAGGSCSPFMQTFNFNAAASPPWCGTGAVTAVVTQ